MNFPKLSEERRREMLAVPTGRIRAVFDTDARNEIDDQFALTWALLSPDKITVEAAFAAPFSFQYRIDELIHAHEIQSRALSETLRSAERDLVARYGGWLGRLSERGIN